MKRTCPRKAAKWGRFYKNPVIEGHVEAFLGKQACRDEVSGGNLQRQGRIVRKSFSIQRWFPSIDAHTSKPQNKPFCPASAVPRLVWLATRVNLVSSLIAILRQFLSGEKSNMRLDDRKSLTNLKNNANVKQWLVLILFKSFCEEPVSDGMCSHICFVITGDGQPSSNAPPAWLKRKWIARSRFLLRWLVLVIFTTLI